MFWGAPPAPLKYPRRACLQARPATSVCGRDLTADEYRFFDVEYAVKHYAEGQHLAVCLDCMAVVNRIKKL